MNEPKRGLLKTLGPGILVAATGVGAGDLATAALVGSELGVAVLWVVVLGSFLKYVLNEGLARWQLATGTTLLEGAALKLGRVMQAVFFVYLVVWTFFTASALMNAAGAVSHAILPLFPNSYLDKIFYGVLHSLLAVALVRIGGYGLFEKAMSAFIAIMFVTVTLAAILVQPDWSATLRGLFVPRVPDAASAVSRCIALMGGVGGTVTVLCYGYWIREVGREGVENLKLTRIDLASGYVMTGLFGLAMVIIGSTITLEEGSATKLILKLADSLQEKLGSVGPLARWAFLIGAWGAIGSSVLGVWQSVPYLFADFYRLSRMKNTGEPQPPVDANSAVYRWHLYGLATIPMVGLFFSFKTMQLLYAIIGACFMPLLALTLLLLNGTPLGIPEKQWRNSAATNLLLVLLIVVFGVIGYYEVAMR